MNAAPPKIAPSNARFAAIVVTIIAAGIAAVVYFFNPSAHHFYPVCQFHRLTGLNCPGCGGTRALYALLHGDPATAFRDNALFVVGLPIAAARGGWFALNRWRRRPNGQFFPPKYLIPFVVATGLFGILRNLPPFAFLSP
ncbi:MAG: DUF2752 domain-containing protein [Verrucomicrobiota bacterium]|jgi:hypothetical protein